MLKEDFGIEPKCKKSCSKLEYFGELLLTFPYQSEEKGYENWTVYYLQYKSTNVDLVAKLWKEYLIYDRISRRNFRYYLLFSLEKTKFDRIYNCRIT